MNRLIKNTLKNALRRLNIGITQYSTLEQLRESSATARDFNLIQRLEPEVSIELLKYFPLSKSQLRQDLFAISHHNFKKNGYYVEFGATNGVDLSNTYFLEKHFGWEGILAEPGTVWHNDLRRNRKCNIETRCVWKDSASILTFNETTTAEFSTINKYTNLDSNSDIRKSGKKYNVETISLNDLLEKFDSPGRIDYLSIDTEGSEYEILSELNFSKYTFGVITCEHNYTDNRGKIYALLSRNGYKRVWEDISLFDDWYVLE